MWYKTDLMEQILTSESAKQMIDYVSPIYGKSRIGLWLFQVIGLEIDDVKTICKDIFENLDIIPSNVNLAGAEIDLIDIDYLLID